MRLLSVRSIFSASREAKWRQEPHISLYIGWEKRSGNLPALSDDEFRAVRSRSHRRMWKTVGCLLHLLRRWGFQNIRSGSQLVEKTCSRGSLFASVPLSTTFISQNLTFLSQERKMRFWEAIVGARIPNLI